MKQRGKIILIRVDASPTIGAGHLMRMLALGQILLDSGHLVHFATIPDETDMWKCLEVDQFIIHLLNSKSNNFQQQREFIELADDINPDWVILDTYLISLEFEIEIKAKGYKQVRICDLTNQRTVADVLVDQNFGSEELSNSLESNTLQLRGIKHVMLRREFRQLSVQKSQKKNVERIIIALGGGSPLTDKINITLINILSKFSRPNWSITIVLGKMGINSSDFYNSLENISIQLKVIEHTSSMAAEFFESDIAIVSGGSIMWESLYMKVPFMAISLNMKQEEYLNYLERRNICCHLCSFKDLGEIMIAKKITNFSENFAFQNGIIEKSENIFNQKSDRLPLLDIIEN